MKAQKIIAGALSVFATSSVVAGAAMAQLTTQSKVFADGFGRAKVGMTPSEVAKVAGTHLVALSGGAIQNKGCFYVRPEKGSTGVKFMLTDGRISRIDVVKNTQITTVSGARIGDTESRIKSLYPGQIKVTPHEYVPGGHYLTFTSKDPLYKNYRVVFETDGKRVTQYRAGKLPEVEYIERCS